MFDAEDVLDGMVRGALSGRGKSWSRTRHAVGASGLINARTLLAAAGVAWGLYETWQAQQPQAGGAAVGGSAASSSQPAAAAPDAPDAPAASAAPPTDDKGVPAPVARLLRVMISAARADGELGPAERERILAEAHEVGADELVRAELDAPRPLG